MSVRIVTDLSKEFNPPRKSQHNRSKPKRGNLTKITQKVRNEVIRRSSELHGYPVCERCGVSQPYCFEVAHTINASQMGTGNNPWDGLLLCGPSTNTGTCHHWSDKTKEGREWRKAKRAELIEYYEKRGWK